jgi:iron complex outermembrane receptor protein
MSSSRFLLTPIAAAATLALWLPPAHAQTVPAAEANAPAATLSTVTVNASADASAEGLTKPFAGGQVARGGRVGILGNQDNMSTPFAVTSFTNELIQNQMARSVGDVLLNDPSVSVGRGFGNFQESYVIRGFVLNSDNMSYNGLYSLLPRQYISSELFERVEVLHGASNFLTGITPSGDGLGGTVNLLPKRAANEPLTQVTLGTASGSQFYAATDISRRFGPDNNTGIRLNAAHRDGGTGIAREKVKLDVLSVGLDWRSRDLRLSADIGYQNHRLNEARSNVAVTGVTSIPNTPDASGNWAQPWSYSNERDTFGTVRGEYDINDKVTAWFAAGMRHGTEANSLSNISPTNAITGAATTSRFDNTAVEDVRTGEIGIRANVVTGPVKHALVASYAVFASERKNAYKWDFFNTQATNLYNPVFTTVQPPFSGTAFSGNDLADPAVTSEKRLSSYAIGDTMSFLDDKLALTLGLRHQKLDNHGYAYGTPLTLNSYYNQSKTSPAVGVVFKARTDLSVYANYIEGLSPGGTAPIVGNTVNPGAVLAPSVTKQGEIGLKYDGGSIGAGVALFSTDKPRDSVLANGAYGPEGKDVHQGVEITFFGEPVRGLRLLGGVTLIDAKQKSGVAATDGKKVVGVSDTQANLGVDWDVPGVRGLSLNGRLIVASGMYANHTNTLKTDGWNRLDVGARYMMEVGGKLVTLRGRIDNLTDRNYWSSAGGPVNNTYIVLGAPRTFSLTASVDF